ncbi:MAG: hypothetical protein ACPG4T_00175 [Nannocystaceae bacterium]
MSFARISLVAACLTFVAAPSGCRKDTSPPVAVVDDDAPDQRAQEPAPTPEPAPVAVTPDPNAKPMRVRASAREIRDMLEFVRIAIDRWSPESSVNPEAQIQAMLLQFGYGPGMWTNLNLDGVMAIDAEFPPPGSQMVVNNRVVGTLATVNTAKVIEAVPMTHRPQPLGNGLWELVRNEVRVLFREQAATLEFGLDMASLDAAPALAQQASNSGHRLSLTAWDFPTEGFQVSSLIGLPRSTFARTLDEIVAGMTSASFGFDAGQTRDIQMTLSAEAEFGRLGLGKLGAPRTAPTRLEQSLPGDAVAVISMPWGSPETFHKNLDRLVPVDRIPAPFDTLVREALASAHKILDGISDDVLLAGYLSPRGEVTVVLAAGVRDEATTRSGVRSIVDVLTRALASYNALSGGTTDVSFKAAWKPDAVRSSRGKVDQLTVTFPKNMQRELDAMAPLVSKKKAIEVYLHVDSELAVVAFGAGAKKYASQLSQTPRASLGSDAGLALARQTTGGCHFCLSVDPLASARMFLTFVRLDPNDTSTEERVRIDRALKSLATVKLVGGAGAGLRFDAKQGAVGMGVSNSLALPPAATVTKLKSIFTKLSGEAKASSKPLKLKKNR